MTQILGLYRASWKPFNPYTETRGWALCFQEQSLLGLAQVVPIRTA